MSNRKSQIRYERRQTDIHEKYARNYLIENGTCPRCGLGAHKPDSICDTIKKELES